MSKVMTAEERIICKLQDVQGFRKQKAVTSLKNWIMSKTEALELEYLLGFCFPECFQNIYSTNNLVHF